MHQSSLNGPAIAELHRFAGLESKRLELLNAERRPGSPGYAKWQARSDAAEDALLDQAMKVAAAPGASFAGIVNKLAWLERMMAVDSEGAEPGGWEAVYLATIAGVIADLKKLSDA